MLAKLPCQLMIVALLFGAMAYSQTPVTVTLEPSQDNTISPNDNPERSNGSGTGLFIGRSNSGRVFRALIQFDLDTIPSGAMITEVSFSMNVNRANQAADSNPFDVFRLINSWGEGASVGQGNGGGSLAPLRQMM